MTESARASQRLVLLVEDSDETYELYSEILAGAGYAIEGATSGEDACQRAVELHPDLIVMDYQLLGLDGCEATRLLKADPRTAEIPILMLTGHVGRHHVERAQRCGCDAFLLKPCHVDDLLAEVHYQMELHVPHAHDNTIFIVEDDEAVVEALSDVLRVEGYAVRSAQNGKEALDALRSLEPLPRLILLDLMMPVMDGWSFRREQLRDGRLARVPVVVLSARTDARSQAATLSIERVVPKPIDVPRLLSVIHQL
jgi:CheY-like chemotaxis protein